MNGGFSPPDYPYERLRYLASEAESAAFPGGLVDLSIGAPCDPPPPSVAEELAAAPALRGYPASRGTDAYRAACAGFLSGSFGVELDPDSLAACIGTKELVASLPHYLRLRRPDRDTVLYPEISYPTYEMGALLAGCRAVPVPVDSRWRLDLSSIGDGDVERALLLWVNSPGNPAGQLDDLSAVAGWGAERGVLIASDECYADFTWQGGPRSILESGTAGLLAIHSISKRSNLAGLRAGFYAGDPGLVGYLSLARMHAGMMVPGPVQAAAARAWSDVEHLSSQRETYRRRLARLVEILTGAGAEASMPEGGIYIWARCPTGKKDAWEFARFLARRGGVLVSPGDLYGPAGKGFVRVAAVQPDERLEMVAERLKV